MNNDLEKVINFDYVLSIKELNRELQIITTPIAKYESLLGELKGMINDYNKSLYDMQLYFRNNYHTNNRYYDKIKHLDKDNQGHYKETRFYLFSIPFSYDDCHGWGNTEPELNNSETTSTFDSKDKEEFFNKCNCWIKSCELEKICEELESNPEILIHSDEVVGTYSRGFSIGHDLEFRIDTNFGYGRSAFFKLNVYYKNIPNLPYSLWGKPTSSGFHFTRKFPLRRSSWKSVFELIIKFVDYARII